MRQAARAQCEQQRRCGGTRHGFACIWCGRTDSRLPPRQRQRTSTHSTRSGAQWLGTVTEDYALASADIGDVYINYYVIYRYYSWIVYVQS